jgi:hypothetical protein
MLLVQVSLGLAQDGLAGVSSQSGWLLGVFLALMLLDALCLLVAFRLEKRFDWKLLALVPLVRVGYRQLLYVAVYRAVWRAMSGRLVGWNKLKRTGQLLTLWNRRQRKRRSGEVRLPGQLELPLPELELSGAMVPIGAVAPEPAPRLVGSAPELRPVPG